MVQLVVKLVGLVCGVVFEIVRHRSTGDMQISVVDVAIGLFAISACSIDGWSRPRRFVDIPELLFVVAACWVPAALGYIPVMAFDAGDRAGGAGGERERAGRVGEARDRAGRGRGHVGDAVNGEVGRGMGDDTGSGATSDVRGMSDVSATPGVRATSAVRGARGARDAGVLDNAALGYSRIFPRIITAWRRNVGGVLTVMDTVRRWLWILPLVVMIVRFDRVETAFRVLVALAAVIMFLFGRVTQMLEISSRRLLLSDDQRRYEMRRLHRRLAVQDEDRSDSIRRASLEERTRIAREIHDNVGHLLTRAIMQAQASRIVAQQTGDVVAAQGFSDVGVTLTDAMTMTRRSVHDLEDNGTDFAAQMTAATHAFDGIPDAPRVRLENGIANAPAAVARCMATCIREALNNTVRHSNADRVDVVLRDFPALWQLVMQDNGGQDNGVLDSGGLVGIPDSRVVGGQTAEPRTADALQTAEPRTAGVPHAMAHTSVRSPFRASSFLTSSAVLRPSDRPLRGMGLADIQARAEALGGSALCGPYGDGWRVFMTLPKHALS